MNSPLYVTEADVARLVTIDDAIASLEEAFASWPDKGTANLSRQRAPLPGGFFNVMAAAYASGGVFGLKAYFSTAAGGGYHVALYSVEEARLVAIIEANLLSQLRTGASSGVATRLLANPDARNLAIIGAGKQAFAQVTAVCAVRPIHQVRVFSRSMERRHAFVRRIENELQKEAIAMEDADDCVADADVVVTITKAAEPFLRAEALVDGVHVNAAGANAADRREIEAAVVMRADLRVTDDKQQAEEEAAEFRDLVREGRLAWSDIHDLGDVAAGKTAGRRSPSEVTLFKSLGIALEDVAFAKLIHARAVEGGLKRTV